MAYSQRQRTEQNSKTGRHSKGENPTAPLLSERFALPKSEEEDDAAECQFDGHSCPYAREAHIKDRCQRESEREAHTPHRSEVHKGRNECVASSHTAAIGHDGSRKHRFSKSFNAQSGNTEVDDFLNRREDRHH